MQKEIFMSKPINDDLLISSSGPLCENMRHYTLIHICKCFNYLRFALLVATTTLLLQSQYCLYL